MSLRLQQGWIVLEGRCGAEDAELLLRELRDGPGAAVNLTGVQTMHLAVLQVLLVVRPQIGGPPADAFLRKILLPLISDGDRG